MEGLFRGTWYLSDVKIEKVTRFFKGIGKRQIDSIVPDPPFKSYNPFDWYYSANLARQGERSLYFEFLAVDANKTEEVAEFCQRFGVLGDPIQAKTYAMKRSRKSVNEFIDGYGGLSAKQKNEFLTYRERSVSTVSCPPEILCPPLTVFDFKGLQEKIRRNVKIGAISSPITIDEAMAAIKKETDVATLPETVLTDESKKNYVPHTFFKAFLSEGINTGLALSDVRPEIEWNIQENKWELSWQSFSLIGYFWTMVMLDQLGTGNILSCPRCHKLFMTASNRMKYCSSSCYDNFKVQKYLKKKRENETAAQKGKKGKATQATTRKK